MARIKKPCVRCGSMERYGNGGCKPCQRIKQRPRNQAGATGQGKISSANGNARSQAALNKEKLYERIDSCPRCMNKLYYTSGGNCMDCNYIGAPENPDNKPPRPIKQRSDSVTRGVGRLIS